MDIGVEERLVAIEAIATLVNIKHTMVELILKPAGIPVGIYRPLLAQQDDVTGQPLSKRKVAPLLFDRLGPDSSRVVRAIIEIAAQWPSDRFHLARNEFEARATVQKAREVLGTLELMDAREAEERRREIERREQERKEELAQKEQERAAQSRKELGLLLMMFDDLVQSSDHQHRGFLLQDLLTRLFNLNGISAHPSFTRNAGGGKIDGAFRLEGWYYLAECRWRQKLADIRDLDGLSGQIGRGGRQTMGLFLSINGWSENVVNLLKQNAQKSIILMDGYDLRTILDERIDLQAFLLAKLAHLNLKSEPFLGAPEYIRTVR